MTKSQIGKTVLVKCVFGGKRQFCTYKNNKIEVSPLPGTVGNMLVCDEDITMLPTLPKKVADYLENCKERHVSLARTLANAYIDEHQGITDWASKYENQDHFALAWLFGYEVEQEKKYRVTLPNEQTLSRYHGKNDIRFRSSGLNCLKTSFTCEELEESGFGWIWKVDEIEKVEVTDD